MPGKGPSVAKRIVIRSECPEDYTAIDEIHRLAFDGNIEAKLVRRIRAAGGFDPRLSLVAVDRGHVVGHILFSPIVIEDDSRRHPALALAPMAVRPARQREEIGSQLVREGLAACRAVGHTIVVVVGHAQFYPRFGFSPARTSGVHAPFPVPDESFMILSLTPNAHDGVQGTVRYPPAFEQA